MLKAEYSTSDCGPSRRSIEGNLVPASSVIFFSIGLPSYFTEWCDMVTTRLVQRALGPVEAAGADTIEQFALAVIKARSPYLVVWSRQTIGHLWEALAQASQGIIVVVDDPRVALENLVVKHGIDFVEATRVVAKSCAAVMSATSMPGALVLRASADDARPVATADAIVRHFGFAVSDSDLANILADLDDRWPGRPQETVWWDSLNDSERVLATGALEPYVGCLAGGDLLPITWGRELFFINEEQHEEPRQPASRAADITGRPRYIVHGPYITLPAGSWSATVALGFSEGAAELSYIVDVHAQAQLSHVRIEPAKQRFVEANLNFSITEPHMITIGVYIERAAFDGRLALGHVIVTPHARPRPETHKYFATALSA